MRVRNLRHRAGVGAARAGCAHAFAAEPDWYRRAAVSTDDANAAHAHH